MSGPVRVPAYDPFGESVEAVAACPATPDVRRDRQLRSAAVAVFWTLALLFTAGRAYFGDHAATQALASDPPPVDAVQLAAVR